MGLLGVSSVRIVSNYRACQTRTVVSWLPEAMRLLSGDHANALSTAGHKYDPSGQWQIPLPDRKSVRGKTAGLITCREGFYALPASPGMSHVTKVFTRIADVCSGRTENCTGISRLSSLRGVPLRCEGVARGKGVKPFPTFPPAVPNLSSVMQHGIFAEKGRPTSFLSSSFLRLMRIVGALRRPW